MRMKIAAYGLVSLGVLGLGASLWLYVRQPRPPKQLAGVSMSAPSSVKPSPKDVANYIVAPDQPKYIAIPAAGVAQARVLRLGRLVNGQITTPNNIYDTGWYEDSGKPGQAGAMFIFGHVSSWTAKGVFYDLKSLKSGDKITVTRGDNKAFVYQVVAVKVYPSNNVDMHAVLSPVSAGVPGLNLMTCTGSIIKGTSDFSERLVVFTSLTRD